jgi:hypothetical protein
MPQPQGVVVVGDNGERNIIGGYAISRRTTTTVYRMGVTSADTVAKFADLDYTVAAQDVGGSLVNSTDYYVGVVPGNSYGSCQANTTPPDDTMPIGADDNSMRVTIPQAVGAEYYDLFLGLANPPDWVGRVTEIQRATGGYEVTAVGVVAAGGGNPPGTVDINVVGTGIKWNAGPWTFSNAVRPTLAAIPAISCSSYVYLYLAFEFRVTDLRVIPALSLAVFVADTPTVGNWALVDYWTAGLVIATPSPLRQERELNANAASSVKVLVANIAGYNAVVDMYVGLG